jgi:hypothetical protein
MNTIICDIYLGNLIFAVVMSSIMICLIPRKSILIKFKNRKRFFKIVTFALKKFKYKPKLKSKTHIIYQRNFLTYLYGGEVDIKLEGNVASITGISFHLIPVHKLFKKYIDSKKRN